MNNTRTSNTMNKAQIKNIHRIPPGQLAIFTVAAALTVLIVSGGSALAHHGDTGRYDASTPIVLAGTVTRATFSPPHPVLSVRVEAADADLPASEVGRPDDFTGPFVVRPEDAGQVREIEFSPVSEFYSLGDQISIGDRVVVLALRNCLPPHQLRSTWIQLPDGQAISYTGDWAPGVDGCSS